MSDNSFYSPNRTPNPPRKPKPGEHLWSLVVTLHSKTSLQLLRVDRLYLDPQTSSP